MTNGERWFSDYTRKGKTMETTRITDHTAENRYAYDWGPCSFQRGFAQVDTPQDASYFGTWCNPFTLKIVEYCEGDTTIQAAANDTEFVDALRVIDKWNRDQDDRPHSRGAKIDGMCDDELIAKFEVMGLADLLH